MEAVQKDEKRATVLRQIAALDNMTLDQLRDHWRTLYGTEPPAYTQEFLRKRLAVRIQELFYGGLGQGLRARMDTILEENGYDEMAARARYVQRRKNMPVPGTQLIREWNGERYEVTVTRTGFEYCGREYRSLTAIAKVITGTHWNGCVFFGLRAKAKKKE
jgi:hypothetical protein